MRRPTQFAAFLVSLPLLTGVVGCDSGAKVDEVKLSPAAVSADQAGQKGMRDYMQSKTATKSAPAPAPAK